MIIASLSGMMPYVLDRAWRRAALSAASFVYVLSAMCLFPLPAAGAEKGERQAKKIQTGLASYYGRAFDGRKTASGERFDSDELTAAHPTYPLGTRVRVTHLEKRKSVVVRITDRGPTTPNRREGVIIDLSRGAATQLQMRKEGRARVRVQVLEWGDDKRDDRKDKKERPQTSASAG